MEPTGLQHKSAARAPSFARFQLIIPMYDEEAVIPVLLPRLAAVFTPQRLAQAGVGGCEFLFVDDGSTDRSSAMLSEAIHDGFPARLVRLSRNFGHQAAVTAGLDACDADVVGIIDADLQDPPEEILRMLERWREGYHVVYGVRRERKESLFKRASYDVFYRALSFLSERLIPRDAGDFCVIDRRVVEALRALPERIRFLRGLRAWVGFRQIAHEYERMAREHGSPKYTFRKLYLLATDGLASSSIRPLRLTQLLSLIFFVAALGISGWALMASVFGGSGDPVRSLLLASLAFTSIGFFLIFLCFYVIGAYLGRAYLEIKGRPSYVVMEVVNRESAEHRASEWQARRPANQAQ